MAKVVTAQPGQLRLARIVGGQIGAEGPESSPALRPHVAGEHIGIEGLAVPVKDEAVRSFAELLPMTTKLGDEDRVDRSSPGVGDISVLEWAPLGIFVAVEPASSNGTVGAPYCDPPGLTVIGVFDVLPQETCRLTGSQGAERHNQNEALDHGSPCAMLSAGLGQGESVVDPDHDVGVDRHGRSATAERGLSFDFSLAPDN